MLLLNVKFWESVKIWEEEVQAPDKIFTPMQLVAWRGYGLQGNAVSRGMID